MITHWSTLGMLNWSQMFKEPEWGRHMDTHNHERGVKVQTDAEESGRSTKHSWIQHLVLCVHNDKLSRVCAECGETTVWAKLSQQWPSLLSDKPWLETKWTGTGRYNGSVTQSIMASLTQPKAPGKHNRLRLHNSNSESRTYCFILSFWGPNLGPVGPRLENTYERISWLMHR